MRPVFYYYYILQFSPAVPWVYGLVHFRKLDTPLRVFWGYLAASLGLTIVMTIVALQKQHNIWLMNLSPLLYTILIVWTISLWQQKKTFRVLLWMIIPLFAAVWFIDIVVYDRWNEFTTVSRPVEGILFVALACLVIYQKNRNLEYPLLDRTEFWMSAGMLIYFGGTLAINTFSKWLMASQELFRQVTLIQPALGLIACLLYTRGFQCHLHPQKSSGLP